MTCRATLLRSKLQSSLLSTAFCKCKVQQTNKSRWQTSLMITHRSHHIFELEASKRSCHSAFQSSIGHSAEHKQPAAKQRDCPPAIQRSYLCNLMQNVRPSSKSE